MAVTFLTNEDKKELENSIKEVKENPNIPDTKIEEAVSKYLTDNPPEVSGASSWNELEDKPFYDESLNLTYDGNYQDKTYVTDEIDWHYIKVSDDIIDSNKLIGAILTLVIEGVESTITLENSNITQNDGYVYCRDSSGNEWVYIVTSDLVEIAGIELTKGIWFEHKATGYAKSLYCEDIKKLEEKFLPDNISGVSSWNNLTDKPFYDDTFRMDYDGVYSNKEHYGSGNIHMVKLSDKTFSQDNILGYPIVYYMIVDGAYDVYQTRIDETHFTSFGDYDIQDVFGIMINNYALVLVANVDCIIDDNGTTIPKGTYIYHYDTENPIYPSIFSYRILKKLEEKFLPDNIGGASSWNNLLDKPFYDNSTSISYDGNKEGKEYHLYMENEGISLYLVKVSSEEVDINSLIGSTLGFGDSTGEEKLTIEESNIEAINGAEGCYQCLIDDMPFFVICNVDTADINGISVSKGVYFLHVEQDTAVLGYVTNVSCIDFKPLDKKYYPIVWKDIEDRPFYDDKTVYIDWAGDSTDLETVEVVADTTYLCKLSDTPLTAEQLLGATVLMSSNGTVETGTIEESALEITDEYIMIGGGLIASVLVDEATKEGITLTKGLWAMTSPTNSSYVAELYKEDIKQLDEKFIPDSVKLPTFTSEDTNKFLVLVDGVPTWVTLTDVSEEGL